MTSFVGGSENNNLEEKSKIFFKKVLKENKN